MALINDFRFICPDGEVRARKYPFDQQSDYFENLDHFCLKTKFSAAHVRAVVKYTVDHKIDDFEQMDMLEIFEIIKIAQDWALEGFLYQLENIILSKWHKYEHCFEMVKCACRARNKRTYERCVKLIKNKYETFQTSGSSGLNEKGRKIVTEGFLSLDKLILEQFMNSVGCFDISWV